MEIPDLPSADDRQAIFDAVSILTARCTATFGVTYTAGRLTDQPTVLNGMDRRYGLVNSEEVVRWGYAKPTPAGGAANEKTGVGAWNPSARELEVVTGRTPGGQRSALKAADGTAVPENGCASWAWQEIWAGKQSRLDQAVSQILGDAWGRTLNDSRAQAAEKAWVDCMGQAGYQLKHRWEAGNSVASKPAAQQIAMAKLDLACAQKVNYVGIWYAVDSAYQRLLIAGREGQLSQATSDHREMVARASAILRKGA